MTIHHPLDAFKTGSKERIFNNQGQLNAGSTADALKAIVDLAARITAGNINENVDNASVMADKVARHKVFVDAANAGTHSQEWADTGAQIAATIYTTGERSGIARRRLLRVEGGQPTRVRVKDRNNVVAFVASTESATPPTFVTDGWVEIPKVLIHTNPRAFLSEIDDGHVDLVEDLYTRGQIGITVAEDRHYVERARRAAAFTGNTRIAATGFTLETLGSMKQEVESQGLPAGALLLGSNVINDLLSPNFSPNLNIISDYERVRTGTFATLLGMSIETDGLRPLNMRVLDPNEVLLTATPEYHGAFAEHGQLRATPRDNFDDGQPAQGWYMFEYVGVGITNAHSVSLAYRA